LKEKLEVATRVYFDERDFSRTGILEVKINILIVIVSKQIFVLMSIFPHSLYFLYFSPGIV